MSGVSPQELVERALAASRTEGCVVTVEDGDGGHLRWAANAVTTGATARRRLLSVVALHDGRVGAMAVTGIISAGDVEQVVRRAEAAALRAEVAADARPLPAATTSAGWDDPVPVVSSAVLAESGLTAELAECFRAARDRHETLHGYAEHRAESTFLGTSAGARLRHDGSGAHVELAVRRDGYPVWDVAVAPSLGAISVLGLYQGLGERLRWTRRRLELPPGRYECLLPPSAVADLMNYAYTAADARSAADGLSVYAGAVVGEQLTPVPLTLRSNPDEPGLRTRPFLVARPPDPLRSAFDNGLPLGPALWWDRGRLAALVQTRATATESGAPLTPAADNLILEGAGPGRSLPEMIAATRRGLLLSSLWYLREVDARSLSVTGLTRDGVFLVVDGEVVGAVHNFRFDESPVALLSRVSEAGATVATRARDWGDAVSRTAMPALRVRDFALHTATSAL